MATVRDVYTAESGSPAATEGWARRWALAAEEALRRADADLERDHFAEAGRLYLVAAQRYWLALSEAPLDVSARRRLENAHVDAFRAALPSLPYATTPLALLVDEVAVSGYLFLPAGPASAVATVLWPVAAGATAESSYWQVAVPVLEADIAFAVFATEPRRLGDSQPQSGTETIVGAVGRWARQQPGSVNPRRSDIR